MGLLKNLEFSVVIPTYNRPEQLSDCLAALAAQTLPRDRFEVIIVDDGGGAPAAAVAEKFHARLLVRCLRQDNAGPAAARNTGARAAEGQWLAFTDDDCLPAADWLEAYRDGFARHPEAMLGGATVNALPQNPYSTASQLIQDFVYRYYNRDPAQAQFFASNNIAVPGAKFRALGGFHPAFRTSEDREFCARWLAGSGRLISIPAAVVHHAHRLDFRAFWRQHCGYGKGARRYQLALRASTGRCSIEPGFYLSTARCLPRELARHRMPLTMGFLLILWQTANAAGWLSEALASRESYAAR